MKTNLRYVGKQLGIVLLLAVIGIIIFATIVVRFPRETSHFFRAFSPTPILIAYFDGLHP